MKLEIELEDGECEEQEIPCRFEVCGRCQGKGTHVNPSIDGHGITMDEWWGPDWDDESREQYMSGGYDVSCEECGGLRVVEVPDEERMTEQQKRAVESWYEMRREDRNNERWGY